MRLGIGWCSASVRFAPTRTISARQKQKQQQRWCQRSRCRCIGGEGEGEGEGKQKQERRTCKYCKAQFDPALNHASACSFHPAHFGGETKRKFESVYTGGTLNTPDSGKVFQYWHCCGSQDPFHPGCTSAPHASYDD